MGLMILIRISFNSEILEKLECITVLCELIIIGSRDLGLAL